MKKLIKLLSLVFVLSLTTVACNDKKACAADCKKECCETKAEESEAETTEVQGDEQVHVCNAECVADPHSCPNHSHEGHSH